jgi:hypothetical protein
MTRMKLLIVAATLAGLLAGATGQGLSAEDITAAIEQGRAGSQLQKKCSARGESGLDIVAEGPMGRIMRAARDAERRNKPFTAADVTPAMAAPWLTVTVARNPLHNPAPEYVTPGMPGGYKYETSLVIRSRARKGEEAIVLEPRAPITYDTDNSSSRRIVLKGPPPRNLPPLAGADMAASFDLAAFTAIPHEDVEVVAFMTDTGEHKCKISQKERMALR